MTLRNHTNPDVTCAPLLASFITRVVSTTVYALTRMMLGDVTAKKKTHTHARFDYPNRNVL